MAGTLEFPWGIELCLHPSQSLNQKIRHVLGDYGGAIADYSQALKINPNFTAAYYNRGVLRTRSGERQAGMMDSEQAAKLAHPQGNTPLYQQIQKAMRILRFPEL